jgi:glycosyltransferase involved in cell wall biosynthesis
MERVDLVDEIVVMDDGSSDATAAIAAAEGAVVVSVDDVLQEFGPGQGKGDVLWRSLAVSSGDLVVWCDSDIREFCSGFILGVLGPLLMEPDVGFVKGSFEREAGRVTELLARPLLAALRPEAARFSQPLSGSYGGRREVLERLPFEADYGVEVGLLLDALDLLGSDGVAEVHLGRFEHPHRPLTNCTCRPRAWPGRSCPLPCVDLGRRPRRGPSDPSALADRDGSTAGARTGRVMITSGPSACSRTVRRVGPARPPVGAGRVSCRSWHPWRRCGGAPAPAANGG